MLELLRHGDTGMRGFRGRMDDPLSPLGWAQMESAVSGQRWAQIVSSPLQRCRAFADVLAQRLGVSLWTLPELAEYDFGEWTGRTPESLHAESPTALGRFWADPVTCAPPGAESLPAFQRRVLGALLQLSQRFSGRRVLVITHGGVMRCVACQQRGWPLRRMSEIDIAHATVLPVASVRQLATGAPGVLGAAAEGDRR